MSINWLLMPVLMALVIKGTILFVAKRAAIKTDYLWAFIAAFAVHNLCELLAIFDALDGNPNVYLYKVYYSITFVLMAYACSMGIEIGGARRIKWFSNIERSVWVMSGLGVVLSLFTSEILGGLTSLGYIFTAIRGDFYWLFLATSVIALLGSLAGLSVGLKSSNTQQQKRRSLTAILAFFPVVAAALTVLALMSAGYKTNALAVLPLASAVFLVILVYSERAHGLTDVQKIVPGTRQKQAIDHMSRLFSEYALGKIEYYYAIDEIEKLMVGYAHDKHDGNILRTAEHMGLSRSTLYKKMSKHKIGRFHNRPQKPNELEDTEATSPKPG